MWDGLKWWQCVNQAVLLLVLAALAWVVAVELWTDFREWLERRRNRIERPEVIRDLPKTCRKAPRVQVCDGCGACEDCGEHTD